MARQNARTQPGSRTQLTSCVQPGKNRAAAYIRVSTHEQDKHGVSKDAQLEKIRSYCTLQDLDIVRTYTEDGGVSAGKPLDTRPAGAQLLADIKAKRVDHVVILKLDRMFRSVVDCLTRAMDWDRAGIAFHLIDMGGTNVNVGTPAGKTFLTMAAGFAEFERGLIAERTAAALRYKRDQRKAYAPTPYGFERTGELHRESELPIDLTANPAEAEIVELLYEMDAKQMSYRAIASELNTRAIPTKRGGKQWYASTVRKILLNPIHA